MQQRKIRRGYLAILADNSGYAVYDYGKGERLTTQYPVNVSGEPTYFVQVITPTSTIYSNIDSILAEEWLTMFTLLAGTTASRRSFNIVSSEVE